MMKPDTRAAFEGARRALETAQRLVQRDCLDAIKENDAADLVRFYADTSEEADVLREIMGAVAKMEKDLSYSAIPMCFDAHGIQNVRVQGYGLVSLNRRWSCSILDKPRGYEYLRETGQGGMIQETVNAMTLGAWARKEVEDEGKEPPDDIFKTTIARYLSLRASS
jgi:hypothetical protein